MRRQTLRASRRSAVALLFAILAIPIIGLIGVAIDYGFWNQANSAIALAASDAALNAVKTAGSADLARDPNYIQEGETAGATWFTSNVGAMSNAAHLTDLTARVKVKQVNNIITAHVHYNGRVKSIFGGSLFGIGSYPLGVSAAARLTVAPYTEIQILLDNSSSMQIGASQSDMGRLMQLSPCDQSFYYPNPDTQINPGGEPPAPYGGFAYDVGTWHYKQFTKTPVPEPTWQAPALKFLRQNYYGQNLWGYNVGSTCQGATNQEGQVQQGANGYPMTGPPCAFACHWDNRTRAGAGNDLYGMARSTNGTANPIVLRFDIVKQAVNLVLNAMKANNTAANNLSVGVHDFNSKLTPDYPTSGEAGSDFDAAIRAVGSPPTTKNGPDTGIQPESFTDTGLKHAHADTDFSNTATELYNELTASGDGSTPQTPRKFLFLVTDGLEDPVLGQYSPFDTSRCDLYKNPPFNYTVFVVYMQYYPLAWYGYWKAGINNLVEKTGPGTVSYALQQCASALEDYIQANDSKSLNAALQTFLAAALSSQANFIN